MNKLMKYLIIIVLFQVSMSCKAMLLGPGGYLEHLQKIDHNIAIAKKDFSNGDFEKSKKAIENAKLSLNFLADNLPNDLTKLYIQEFFKQKGLYPNFDKFIQSKRDELTEIEKQIESGSKKILEPLPKLKPTSPVLPPVIAGSLGDVAQQVKLKVSQGKKQAEEPTGTGIKIQQEIDKLTKLRKGVNEYKYLFHTQKQEIIPKINETEEELLAIIGKSEDELKTDSIAIKIKKKLQLFDVLINKLFKQNLTKEGILKSVAEFNSEYSKL